MRHELSQEELSFRAGIDRTYPSMMERGLRQPTLGMLVALARALEIPPAKLLAEMLARLHE